MNVLMQRDGAGNLLMQVSLPAIDVAKIRTNMFDAWYLRDCSRKGATDYEIVGGVAYLLRLAEEQGIK